MFTLDMKELVVEVNNKINNHIRETTERLTHSTPAATPRMVDPHQVATQVGLHMHQSSLTPHHM